MNIPGQLRKLLAAVAICHLVGCAGMVSSNDGQRVTIEHDGFVSADSARSVAARACQQAGKTDAKYLISANKNPRLPAGFGVQLSTFECL